MKMNFIPLLSLENGIEVADNKNAEEILNAFAERNEEFKNGKWKEGWHNFCVSMQENYKRVLRGLCTPETNEKTTELFAHFLDCEAHTDVWIELFPTWNATNEK